MKTKRILTCILAMLLIAVLAVGCSSNQGDGNDGEDETVAFSNPNNYAVLEYINGQKIDVAPGSYKLKLTGQTGVLFYTSSNESIGEIDITETDVVHCVKSGEVVLTARKGETTLATVTLAITAPAVLVSSVQLDKTSAKIAVGETVQLTATVNPSGATNKNYSWSTSNSDVATVSNSGLVLGKAAGSANITVTTADGGKTAACAVTVEQKAVVPQSVFKGAKLNNGSAYLPNAEIASIADSSLTKVTFKNAQEWNATAVVYDDAKYGLIDGVNLSLEYVTGSTPTSTGPFIGIAFATKPNVGWNNQNYNDAAGMLFQVHFDGGNNFQVLGKTLEKADGSGSGGYDGGYVVPDVSWSAGSESAKTVFYDANPSGSPRGVDIEMKQSGGSITIVIKDKKSGATMTFAVPPSVASEFDGYCYVSLHFVFESGISGTASVEIGITGNQVS